MTEEHRLRIDEGLAPIACPTLPPSFHPDGQPFRAECRRLRGPVPLGFEQFYRAHLRRVPGERLRSSDVARFYSAWSTANAAPSLNSRELKRAMNNIGHRSMNSNGIRFCDVALAVEHADLPDNFPAIPLPSEARAAAIIDRLDVMTTEISNIRAAIVQFAAAH